VRFVGDFVDDFVDRFRGQECPCHTLRATEWLHTLGAQVLDDCGYVVFLEEADRGDAGGTGLKA